MKYIKRCALCGHEIQMLRDGRPELAYRFPSLLAKLNRKGEFAHPSCIVQAVNNLPENRSLNLKPLHLESDS